MEKIIKFFPFMPPEKNVGRLILAIVICMIAPSVAASILTILLGITVILSPLVPIVIILCGAYGIMGFVLSILSFAGTDFSKKA